MKKAFVIVLVLTLMISVLLVGCNQKSDNVDDVPTYTVMTPDGAPSMAIAKMMMDNNQLGVNIEYAIIGSDAVASSFTNGDADFIIAPTNAGLMLSNRLGTYKMVGVTSWGNLYVVGKADYKSIDECADVNEFLAQFNGKSVSSIGTGLVPDKTFAHILEVAGINATLTASTADLIRADLISGEIELGILGEPAVTATLSAVANSKRLCSISDLWSSVVGHEFTQAGLFVKNSIIQNDKATVDKFIDELIKSIEFLNADAENAKTLGDYMASTGKSTLKGAVVSKCYLQMSQKFEYAIDKKDDILDFVKVLGVVIPSDSDVFYSKG